MGTEEFAFFLPDRCFSNKATEPNVLPQPIIFMRALAHLRSWVAQREDKGGAETAGEISTHSCKVTLLTWGAQLGAPEAWRATQ